MEELVLKKVRGGLRGIKLHPDRHTNITLLVLFFCDTVIIS